MPLTRRELIGAGLAALAIARASNGAPTPAPTAAAPTLLVLGGTGFVGPHIVEAALKRGQKVTLFNRGKTNPGLFPQLEKLIGDRDSDLKALEGRTWDAVVDTSGVTPGEVERAATLLAPHVGRYVFLSSTAVYARLDRAGSDESAPLAQLADSSQANSPTPANYGALKALAEQAADRAFEGRSVSLRCGIVAGPGDPTDRFTYWAQRFARGGEVLVPGAPDDVTQFIDARDFADFVITSVERKLAGAYNVDAQPGAITMQKLVDACKRVAGPNTHATFVAADFLAEQGLAPLTELPLWQPAGAADIDFGRASVAKARTAGLKTRPLEITARDTLEWWRTQSEERRAALRAGLAPEREAQVLAAWHQAAQHQNQGSKA